MTPDQLDRVNWEELKTPAPTAIKEDGEILSTWLTPFLKLETWTPIEAIMLTCGLVPPANCNEIPKNAMGLSGCLITEKLDHFYYAKQYLYVWQHRENPPEKIRPADFVAWCKTQGIETGWITNAPEWAKYEAAQMPQPQSEAPAKDSAVKSNDPFYLQNLTKMVEGLPKYFVAEAIAELWVLRPSLFNPQLQF